MDLRAVSPSLNLYNREWPLRTASYADPPAKFTFDDEDRRGHAIDSIVSGGCILSGGMVRNSVLGRWVRVHSGALVEDSVILDNCDIGRRAKIRRAILDKNVRIPEGATIGYDLDHDRKYHRVTDSGIVVVEGLRSSVDISSLLIYTSEGASPPSELPQEGLRRRSRRSNGGRSRRQPRASPRSLSEKPG